jgi:DNA-binding XRE family transcriptional regulator
MPFVKANIAEERKMLQGLMEADPEARQAVEDFDKEYEFRKKLAVAREAAGLTQKELERRSALDQRTISRIETNRDISPSVKTLMKYLDALGYELDIVRAVAK